ncbi:MAG: NAD(P)-binding protein [Lachnospiraceae bacterium]|nr:NAD(P)-binding protein [Lachnospiraceae bacterium]
MRKNMIRIDNVKLPVEHREGDLEKKLVKILKLEKHNIRSDGSGLTYRILRQSIDARKKPEIFYVYSVAAEIKNGLEETVIKRCGNNNVRKYEPLQYELPEFAGETELKGRPVIIGSGPAGLFCAYILCKKGYAPLILERGECVEDRIKSVESFWAGGKLMPD